MELKINLLDSWLISLSVSLMDICVLLSGTAEDCRQGQNMSNGIVNIFIMHECVP